MSDSPLPQLKTYMPATFAERGALLPFTTPLLVGSRARTGEQGTQLIVPKLSGGSGLYVFSCSTINQLCRATVHDRVLNQRLEKLPGITPRKIRETAQGVALAGLAGQEARTAAETAQKFDQQMRDLSAFLLLKAFYGQIEPQPFEPTALIESDPKAQEIALRAVMTHAPQFGLVAETLPQHLKQVGETFSAVGIHGSEHCSRVLVLLDMLASLQDELAKWSKTQPHENGEVGGMIAEVAGATLTCAVTTMRDARVATKDVVTLMRNWPMHRASFTELAERTEWLLDGWEPICQLWRQAQTDVERDAILAEIAPLVPVLPRETGEWARLTIRAQSTFTYRNTVLVREDWRVAGDGAASAQGRKIVRRNQDWRTSSLVDLVARNEHLHALSV